MFPNLLRSVKTVSSVYDVRQFAKHESLDESTYPNTFIIPFLYTHIGISSLLTYLAICMVHTWEINLGNKLYLRWLVGVSFTADNL